MSSFTGCLELPDWMSSFVASLRRGTTRRPLLNKGCLETISDDLLVTGILPYLHFDELKEVVATRPDLSNRMSLEYIIQSFHPAEHWDAVRFEEYVCRQYWGTRLYMPSPHRFCRILDRQNRDSQKCEACGASRNDGNGVGFFEWWGLFLCRNCECLCDHQRMYFGCDPTAPSHFSRWILNGHYPSFS
ncbi:MAG: hypothetical protein SGARI_005857, partial [Bacillariaceae sp.]